MADYKHSILELDFDHEGMATERYMKSLDKRMKAFKRQILWALATDLLDLVRSKIPNGKRYAKMSQALKVGEVDNGESFAVFMDTNAKGVKSVDVNKTLFYVKPRRLQDKLNKALMVVVENGPWTADAIPFWPTPDQAIVTQRKVEVKMAEKIAKMQEKQKEKIKNLLKNTGYTDSAGDDSGKAKRRRPKNIKAVPDMAFEMLSLEFGRGKERASSAWRNSLAELSPGMIRTLLSRYKKIERTLGDPSYNGWERYPSVKNKITAAQVKSFSGFQKRIGIK